MAKILYHHRTASRDGQRVHIDEMVHAWKAAGHEVVMVEPGAASDGAMGKTSGLIKTLKSYLPGALYELAELIYSIPAYVKLYAAYRRERPDFLYERYQSFMLAGRWLAKTTGIVFLSEVNAPLTQERQSHGTLKLPGLAGACDGLIWRAADQVLPVTQVLAGYVTEKGVPAERITVIPNGANMDLLSKAPSVDEAKETVGLAGATVLGFTGFIREWHGIDRVLPLLEARPETALLVVGDGPARASIEAQAKERGVDERVHFTGFVERADVPRYVAAFDVALQPDVVEYASPLKLFDYLGLGKPVVAPDTPNIREVLTQGDNALLFDAADEEAFTRCVDALLADPQLQARLSDASYATIAKGGYKWRKNAARVIGLYEDIKKERRS
ncbi:MAG: glycosyltransferase family 4 protein [Pseudomonadota bacterium]